MSNERTVMFQMPSVLSGTLACIAGTVAGRSWDLSAGTFVIGRLESCDLHLPSEPGVSKTHAKIVAEGDSYVLVDCESRNGTIVNGAPVQRAALRDGDEIRVCGCVLRFTQRGGNTGIKVRNADPPREAVDLDIDEVAVPPTAPHIAAHAQQPQFSNVPSSSVAPVASPTERVYPDERQPPPAPAWDAEPSQMIPQPSYPPRGRVLATWYAGGLVGALLFGGTGTAVLAMTSSPAEVAPVEEAAAATESGARAAASVADSQAAKAPPGKAEPANTDPAPPPATDPPKDPAPVAVADTPPVVPPPVETKEEARPPVEPTAEPKAEVKVARNEPRDEPRERPRREAAAESNDGDRKAYPATAEGGRSETLRAKGGKVKSVEVREGDIVGKGEVVVTFEEGDNAEEIATLRDRVASLEGIDDDEARRDLKAAKAKLEALSSSGGGPVIAGMAGRLTGFGVSAGQVLKSGEVIGRIVEGEVSRRVKVRVDRGTKVRRGQEATLILRRGGEAPGTVSAVSGRNVTVETNDVAADEVASVKF